MAGFLKGTKTFHDVYAPFTSAAWAPTLTFLVSYGHLLIGLSLLVGLYVRASAAFGILLVLLYWTAHMDFPYIENKNNFLLDFHIVYAGVLVLLIVERAGHVWGLDAWAAKLAFSAGTRNCGGWSPDAGYLGGFGEARRCGGEGACSIGCSAPTPTRIEGGEERTALALLSEPDQPTPRPLAEIKMRDTM